MTWQFAVFLAEFSLLFLVWATVMIYYAVSSGGRWRFSATGRYLMADAACLTWNAGLILFNVAVPNYEGRFAVQVASYGALVLVGVARLVLMHREWLRRRRAPATPGRAGAAPESLRGTRHP